MAATIIKTKLTERLGIRHPVIQAPMALAAGGKLAATVSKAGGLGLIGGGYGDSEWLSRQFKLAGRQSVGCGLITWSLQDKPHLLQFVLEQKPSAMFLSFGDPAPFASDIKAANVPLICQIQTLRDAKHAMDAGADIIVAQGAEAGGHGEKRATFTIVPEVADYIARHSPDTLLCAAGGVADGRGLAAALMLGADGVVIGSRFWASEEALVHPNMLQAAVDATGDETIRSSVMDIARKLAWPDRYTARVLKNAFTERWHNDINGLISAAEEEAKKWSAAWVDGEVTTANTFVGEATGLIGSIKPAAEILESIISEAEIRLRNNFV
jgi:nitronate monooxygenase